MSLEDRFARHFAASPPDAVAARRAALARFEARGFPTRRDENWKYTDLKPIADGGFDLFPPPPSAEHRAAVAARIDASCLRLGGARLVFVDGHVAMELSERVADLPFELGPPCQAQNAADNEPHALAMLNAAFVQHGCSLRVPRGARLPEPLLIVFAASPAGGLAPQLRLQIELAPGAELTVVQQFIDAGEPASWTNLVTEAHLADGAQLNLYRLQTHGAGHCHTSLLAADLARDARLTAAYLDLGGRLVRNDLDVRLGGPGAAADLTGLFLAEAGQHIDNHLRVDHRAPHTRSTQTFRGIAGAKGRGVFNGKVIVRPGAQQIDARQSSDNLLLARNAEIDTKPELEIYADDVKCAHGATVGELDHEQLFYLRARGIDEKAARALLTFAFANRVLEHIALAPVRDEVARHVAGALPGYDGRGRRS